MTRGIRAYAMARGIDVSAAAIALHCVPRAHAILATTIAVPTADER